MTRFVDGPAKGHALMLRMSPRYLRVTRAAGVWDALDLPEDNPRSEEEVYVYRRRGEEAHCFIDFGGKARSQSGCYAIAEYEFIKEQPPAGMLRDPELWQYWCDHSEP